MKTYELMSEDLINRLKLFYEQPQAEQEIILALVLEAANASPSDFIELIHQQKFDSIADELANNLPIFYQALAVDLNNWADFFLLEANRLLTIARTAPVPHKILSYLDEFCFIKANEFKHRDALVTLLSKELENETVAFRYYAAWVLPDFIRHSDSKTIDKLRQLLHDPNWRIRYQAYYNLKDFNLLYEQNTLSWIDRLRGRVWNPFKLD